MMDIPTIILMCIMIILILVFAGVTIRMDNADKRLDRLQETISKKQQEPDETEDFQSS